MTLNKGLLLFFKSAISVALIIFLMRMVEIDKFQGIFFNINYPYFLIALLFTPSAWIVYTLRWQILLSAIGHSVHFSKLLSLNLIGMFYNLFLPTHIGGEILKIFRLSNLIGDVSKSIISVIMDKITSILPRLILIPICLLIDPPFIMDSKLLTLVGIIMIGIVPLTILSIIIILSRRAYFLLERVIMVYIQVIRRFYKKVRERCGFTYPEDATFVKKKALSVGHSLKIYHSHPIHLWISLAYGVIAHLLDSGFAYLMALALNINISFWTILWVLAIIAVIQMIPISISGIGVREGTFVFLLSYYRISPTIAVSISLIIFFFQILVGLVGGFMEIWARKGEGA